MNGSISVGGWGVVILVAAAACGEDSAPREVSTPMSLDTDGSDTDGAPVGENPAPSDGEGDAVPTQAPSTEAPVVEDLAPSVPEMSGAGVADSGAGEIAEPEPDPWITLFNGENLDGWTVSRGGGAGQPVEEIFQVTDGMLHVYKGAVQGSAQPTATIRTNESYSHYVFQFEYMWGTPRFIPRENTFRDAGILFHLFNDLNVVWPDSMEFQMGSSPLNGEWVTGDIFVIGNQLRGETTSIQSGGGFVFAEPGMGGMRRPIGAPNSYERGRTSVQLDQATGWNTIELTVRGAAEAEYKLNGVVVNRVFNMERVMGGGFQVLDSGPIALQAEYAELFYRNIRLMQLPAE